MKKAIALLFLIVFASCGNTNTTVVRTVTSQSTGGPVKIDNQLLTGTDAASIINQYIAKGVNVN